MQLKDLKKENWIIYECIAGSHAYNTYTKESDIDIRGIFCVPNDFWFSTKPVIQQVSDKTNDVTFYELRRYFELASDCNPNIIELLWIPEDCHIDVKPMMKYLIDNRELFISKKAYHTFSGYAYSQISRARGINKRINSSLSKGLGKLINLYKEGKITKEWLESRFCSQVVEEILKKG
ncbi:MAG: DNA polymerase beta superfamily protein [bacterium]